MIVRTPLSGITFFKFYCILAGMFLCNTHTNRPHDISLWQQMKNAWWGSHTDQETHALLFYKYDKHKEVQTLLDLFYTTKDEGIIKENEWRELDLDLLLDRLDRTVTSYGKWGLKKSIMPHTNLHELQCTQDRIAFFLKNGTEYMQAKQALRIIGAYDDALLAYFNPNNKLHTQAKPLYYERLPKGFNYNRWALEATYGAELVQCALQIAALFGIEGLFKEPPKEGQADYSIWAKIKKGFSLQQRYHNPYPQLLKNKAVKDGLLAGGIGAFCTICSHGSGGDQYIFMQHKSNQIADYITQHPRIIKLMEHHVLVEKGVTAAVTGVTTLGFAATLPFLAGLLISNDVAFGLRLRYSMRTVASYLDITKQLHEQLIRIAGLITAAHTLVQVLPQESVFSSWQPVQTIRNFINKESSASSATHELLDLLNDDLFAHSSAKKGLLFSRGKVLLAHRLLQENCQEWIPFLQAVGMLDAFVSVVSLYKEHENQEAQFCFAQWVESAYAGCNLADFWNPLVTQHDFVFNSIQAGIDGSANKIILTGPNGGGKSTTMKAIAYAFIMGLSWGIVPAKSASLSVLTGIRTALKPEENIVKGLSSFMAEKLRLNQITRFIANYTKPNDTILVLLDEPYKGTVEAESAQRICAFSKEIASSKGMVIMATHLEKPITLESETGGLFKNYQLEFQEVEQGQLFPTYRLLPGPALWWFADHEKRKRYIDCIYFGESEE
jgi:hypothetical protein